MPQLPAIPGIGFSLPRTSQAYNLRKTINQQWRVIWWAQLPSPM
jgi:hypothetical protein